MATDREFGSRPASEPLDPGTPVRIDDLRDDGLSDEDEPLATHITRALNLNRVLADERGLPVEPVMLEHFEFVRMIGRGGMGRVFEARDTRLDRRVAIKICGSTGDEAMQLFAREARLLAKVHHPNVVTVHAVLEARGELAIVMEYIQGRTLREWVCQDAPSWREILDRFDDAGRGLEAIHAAGLEHGDFKPDNVMLGDDGVVRVLDLGIARSRSPSTADDPSSTRGGTLAYLPPELLRTNPVNPRGDVFAFCGSIWELVFGARPFKAYQLLLDHTPATITEFRPQLGVPDELAAVLRRGLSWTASKRWETIGEVRAALRDVVRGRAQVTARRWQWAGIGAFGLLCVSTLGLGLALVAAKRPGEQAPAESPPAEVNAQSSVDHALKQARIEAGPEGDPKSAVNFLEIAHSRALRHERNAQRRAAALRRVAEQATIIGDQLRSRNIEQARLSWGVARSCYRDLGEFDNMKAIDNTKAHDNMKPTLPRVPQSK